MNQSWRHHYIPQFYLRGFTNSAGFFNLFNKRKGIIEKNPKSPESYFFERDRNTFKSAEKDFDDYMETSFYKKFDDLSKYAFEKLRTYGAKSINDEARALISIIQFINGIFFRIPSYDDYHNQEILSGNSKYFLPIFQGDVDVSRAYYENHKHEDLYRYSCRFFLSLQGIIPVGEELKKWTVIELPGEFENQLFLTSDCPLILSDENLYNTGREIILAPLTERHLAIRVENQLPQDLNMTELIYFVNLYLQAIAKNYICCSNLEVLKFYKDRINWFDRSNLKNKILSLVAP